MNALEKDMRCLSERFEDRQAQTDEEKEAAQYVLDRLAPRTQSARRVDFAAIGNHRLVFPAYCGEFIVVSLVAFWWPTVAFFYGLTMFMAYMAEFIGYPVFSRFFPHFESSSAVGMTETGDCASLILFTAFLDTDDNPFARIEAVLTKYYLHYLVLLGMVFVLATCGIDALGALHDRVNPYTFWMRLAGVGMFSGMAAIGALRALASRENRGANNNASGLAALLHIADRLEQHPIENAMVLFYAAGSHHANMGGMRTMLVENPEMARDTYVVNIEGVGAGNLCYTRAEGILHQMPCAPDLVAAAKEFAGAHNASPVSLHHYRTNAYLPLMRGIHSISILRQEKNGLPAAYGDSSDLCDTVNFDAVEQAACFAEAIGREAARRHVSIPEFEA